MPGRCGAGRHGDGETYRKAQRSAHRDTLWSWCQCNRGRTEAPTAHGTLGEPAAAPRSRSDARRESATPAVQPLATQAASGTTTQASQPVDTGNPSHNDTQLFIAMDTACRPGGTSCRSASLSAVDAARAQEGLGAMAWPTAFWNLPDREQLLIAVNEERTSRKLPPVRGLTAQLDVRTQQAAVLGADPTYKGNADWSGIWAQADNALFADFLWIYEDGYSTTPQFGENLDCRPGDTAGCWGHRKAILYRWPDRRSWQLAMGASCIVPTTAPSLPCAAIFVDRPGAIRTNSLGGEPGRSGRGTPTSRTARSSRSCLRWTAARLHPQ